MAIIRLQGKTEQESGVYYQFDTSSTPLGEGGMGKVYRGQRIDATTGLKRDVAIKFMFDGLAASVIERARREASIRIKHDNLVEMMGFLTTEHIDQRNGHVQRHYHVVSEFLDGVVLSDLLKGVVTGNDGTIIPYAQQLHNQYKSNAFGFAVLVVKNVLSGIMALHDAGYIHRDIDPSNIMVTRNGKIKIIDFGIAKQVSNLATQDKALTSTGVFIGKSQYASPELIYGDVSHQNKTTDIYAIGIMMYELMVGRLPFNGTVAEIQKAQINQKVPIKDIHSSMARKIVLKATEKVQDKRYQTAAQFRVAVEELEAVGESMSLVDKVTDIIGMKWVGGMTAAIVACMIGYGVWTYIHKASDAKPATETLVAERENATVMDDIKAQLTDVKSAPEGLKALEAQVARGDVEATYLLSRLLVGAMKDPLPDEILPMKANVKGILKSDDFRAHQLLLQVVKLQPNYYKAVLELAIDCYRGKERTGNEERNLDKAKELFLKAKQLAVAQKDQAYVIKVDSWLEKF